MFSEKVSYNLHTEGIHTDRRLTKIYKATPAKGHVFKYLGEKSFLSLQE